MLLLGGAGFFSEECGRVLFKGREFFGVYCMGLRFAPPPRRETYGGTGKAVGLIRRLRRQDRRLDASLKTSSSPRRGLILAEPFSLAKGVHGEIAG